MFGRWAKVIYVGQPARPRHDNDLQEQNEQIESEIDPNKTTGGRVQAKTDNKSESPTITNEIPTFQIPKSQTVTDETSIPQMPPATEKHKSTIETPTTTKITLTQDVAHPTMELTTDKVPSLPTQKQDKHTVTKPVLEDGGFFG